MGIDIDVEEDGLTFEENAKKKSVEIYKELIGRGEKDFIVISDDSGLEVDYSNGEPEFSQQDMQGNMEMIKRTMKNFLIN